MAGAAATSRRRCCIGSPSHLRAHPPVHPGAQAAAQPRGAFIVLEGADRAGKTTQCTRLVEHLRARGLDARLWRFPDRSTTIGRMIDAYLKSQAELDDAAVHLLFSANRWEKRCVRHWGCGGEGGGARGVPTGSSRAKCALPPLARRCHAPEMSCCAH